MKSTAEESAKTKKTREKLKKRLEAIDESISTHALKQKIAEIQRWISRNAPDRVPLKSKTIALFDAGKSVAKVSSRVERFYNALQAEVGK